MSSLTTHPGAKGRAASPRPTLALAYGLGFEELYAAGGLRRIDAFFLEYLAGGEPQLAQRLTTARQAPEAVALLQESQLIIDLAPHVEEFIAQLDRKSVV